MMPSAAPFPPWWNNFSPVFPTSSPASEPFHYYVLCSAPHDAILNTTINRVNFLPRFCTVIFPLVPIPQYWKRYLLCLPCRLHLFPSTTDRMGRLTNCCALFGVSTPRFTVTHPHRSVSIRRPFPQTFLGICPVSPFSAQKTRKTKCPVFGHESDLSTSSFLLKFLSLAIW